MPPPLRCPSVARRGPSHPLTQAVFLVTLLGLSPLWDQRHTTLPSVLAGPVPPVLFPVSVLISCSRFAAIGSLTTLILNITNDIDVATAGASSTAADTRRVTVVEVRIQDCVIRQPVVLLLPLVFVSSQVANAAAAAVPTPTEFQLTTTIAERGDAAAIDDDGASSDSGMNSSNSLDFFVSIDGVNVTEFGSISLSMTPPTGKQPQTNSSAPPVSRHVALAAINVTMRNSVVNLRRSVDFLSFASGLDSVTVLRQLSFSVWDSTIAIQLEGSQDNPTSVCCIWIPPRTATTSAASTATGSNPPVIRSATNISFFAIRSRLNVSAPMSRTRTCILGMDTMGLDTLSNIAVLADNASLIAESAGVSTVLGVTTGGRSPVSIMDLSFAVKGRADVRAIGDSATAVGIAATDSRPLNVSSVAFIADDSSVAAFATQQPAAALGIAAFGTAGMSILVRDFSISLSPGAIVSSRAYVASAAAAVAVFSSDGPTFVDVNGLRFEARDERDTGTLMVSATGDASACSLALCVATGRLLTVAVSNMSTMSRGRGVTVTSAGRRAISSGGISLWSNANIDTVVFASVMFRAVGSITLSALGQYAASSLGLAIHADTKVSLNANDFWFEVIGAATEVTTAAGLQSLPRANVTVVGLFATTAIGISINCGQQSTVNLTNASFGAANSHVKCQGGDAVSSLGIAQTGGGGMIVFGARVTSRDGTNITTFGNNAVTSVGMASITGGSQFMALSGVHFLAAESASLTTVATTCLSSLGVSVYSDQGDARLNVTDVTSTATDHAFVETRGTHGCASVGMAIVSGQNSAFTADFLALAATTSVRIAATGQRCIAAVGVTVWCGNINTLNVSNTVMRASESRVASIGDQAVAALGIATFCADTIVRLRRLTILADNVTASATATSASAASVGATFNNAAAGQLICDDVTFRATARSTITSAAVYNSASVGMASFVMVQIISRLTLVALNSVIASGLTVCVVASSVGLSVSRSTVTLRVNEFSVQVESARISTRGQRAISSAGIAMYCDNGDLTAHFRGLLLFATKSNFTSAGSDTSASAVVGIATVSAQLANVLCETIELSMMECPEVNSTGGLIGIAALGIAVFGNGKIITNVANLSIVSVASGLTSAGVSWCVATVGVAVGGGLLDWGLFSNVSIAVNSSRISARGTIGVAAVGIAQAGQSVATNPFRVNGIVFLVRDSVVKGVGTQTVAVSGIASEAQAIVTGDVLMVSLWNDVSGTSVRLLGCVGWSFVTGYQMSIVAGNWTLAVTGGTLNCIGLDAVACVGAAVFSDNGDARFNASNVLIVTSGGATVNCGGSWSVAAAGVAVVASAASRVVFINVTIVATDKGTAIAVSGGGGSTRVTVGIAVFGNGVSSVMTSRMRMVAQNGSWARIDCTRANTCGALSLVTTPLIAAESRVTDISIGALSGANVSVRGCARDCSAAGLYVANAMIVPQDVRDVSRNSILLCDSSVTADGEVAQDSLLLCSTKAVGLNVSIVAVGAAIGATTNCACLTAPPGFGPDTRPTTLALTAVTGCPVVGWRKALNELIGASQVPPVFGSELDLMVDGVSLDRMSPTYPFWGLTASASRVTESWLGEIPLSRPLKCPELPIPDIATVALGLLESLAKAAARRPRRSATISLSITSPRAKTTTTRSFTTTFPVPSSTAEATTATAPSSVPSTIEQDTTTTLALTSQPDGPSRFNRTTTLFTAPPDDGDRTTTVAIEQRGDNATSHNQTTAVATASPQVAPALLSEVRSTAAGAGIATALAAAAGNPVGASAASKATQLGRTTLLVNCGTAGGDAIAVDDVSFVWARDGAWRPSAAIALWSTSAGIAVTGAAAVAVGERWRAASGLFTAVLVYYGANAAGLAARVLSGATEGARAAAGVALVVAVGTAGLSAVGVIARWNGGAGRWAGAVRYLVEGARDESGAALLRTHGVVDVGAGMTAAVVTSVQYGRRGACGAAALLVVAVYGAQLGYLLSVRPLRKRRDQALSCVNCGGMALLSLSAAAAAFGVASLDAVTTYLALGLAGLLYAELLLEVALAVWRKLTPRCPTVTTVRDE